MIELLDVNCVGAYVNGLAFEHAVLNLKATMIMPFLLLQDLTLYALLIK